MADATLQLLNVIQMDKFAFPHLQEIRLHPEYMVF